MSLPQGKRGSHGEGEEELTKSGNDFPENRLRVNDEGKDEEIDKDDDEERGKAGTEYVLRGEQGDGRHSCGNWGIEELRNQGIEESEFWQFCRLKLIMAVSYFFH